MVKWFAEIPTAEKCRNTPCQCAVSLKGFLLTDVVSDFGEIQRRMLKPFDVFQRRL